MKRLNILISSHELHPDQGSECAVGWNICTKMAEIHDVTVLCASGPPLNPLAYKVAVSKYFDQNPAINKLNIVFVDQPPFTLKCARINQKYFDVSDGVGNRLLFYLGLDAWHRAAFHKAKSLSDNKFNLVHQLTPITFNKPGYMWRLKIPFYWGPIGGMYKVPSIFAKWLGIKSMLFETVRTANIGFQLKFSRCFKSAAKKASMIWAVSKDEERVVKRLFGNKVSVMIDTAPPIFLQPSIREYDGRRPLNLCWSGRHAKYKALQLLLIAISFLKEPSSVLLHVLGDGPETDGWRDIAARLNVTNIKWYGHQPYQDALNIMKEMDIFVHTSIREAASSVVLEALGLGLPVICHDVCGMAVVVDDTCGIKVQCVNPEESAQGFFRALSEIITHPDLVSKLSAGAIERATELSWENKVRQMSEEYIKAVV